MEWLEKLTKEAQEIAKHGQGQMVFNVGPNGEDKTSILIQAGKTYRFIIPRVKENRVIED